MAGAAGPVFQMVLQGTIFDQNFFNVFYYVNDDGIETTADDAGVAFHIGVLPNLRGIQNIAVEYTNLSVQGVRDNDEIASIDLLGENGTVTGSDCLPPFVAWAYIYARSSRLMRNGYKRFPGVSEAWQNGGEVATGTPETTVDNLGPVLKATLLATGGAHLNAVVPKRQFHNVALDPIEYWYPADINYLSISSQTSRKFGR